MVRCVFFSEPIHNSHDAWWWARSSQADKLDDGNFCGSVTGLRTFGMSEWINCSEKEQEDGSTKTKHDKSSTAEGQVGSIRNRFFLAASRGNLSEQVIPTPLRSACSTPKACDDTPAAGVQGARGFNVQGELSFALGLAQPWQDISTLDILYFFQFSATFSVTCILIRIVLVLFGSVQLSYVVITYNMYIYIYISMIHIFSQISYTHLTYSIHPEYITLEKNYLWARLQILWSSAQILVLQGLPNSAGLLHQGLGGGDVWRLIFDLLNQLLIEIYSTDIKILGGNWQNQMPPFLSNLNKKQGCPFSNVQFRSWDCTCCIYKLVSESCWWIWHAVWSHVSSGIHFCGWEAVSKLVVMFAVVSRNHFKGLWLLLDPPATWQWLRGLPVWKWFSSESQGCLKISEPESTLDMVNFSRNWVNLRGTKNLTEFLVLHRRTFTEN